MIGRNSVNTQCFFVGGVARSGTTLLQSILCSDQTTNPLISEAASFRFLVEAYVKTKTNFDKLPGQYFDSLEAVKTFYSECLKLFLDNLTSKYFCENVVLKEPALTKYFPEIFELLPNTKFLCMVRDPRSTIVSMLDWGARMQKHDVKHFFQNRDMDELAKFYNSFYGALLKNKDSDFQNRVKYIRYEDLVAEPIKMVDKIRRFTGLELKGYSPDKKWENSKLDFQDKNLPIADAVTELYGEPISDSRVASYRQVLTKKEQMIIERRCASIFKRFNYKRFFLGVF